MKKIYTLFLCAALSVSAVASAQNTAGCDSLVALPWQKATTDLNSAALLRSINLGDVEKSAAYDLRNKLTGIVSGLEITEACGAILPGSNMASATLTSTTVGFASHGFSSLALIVDDVLLPFNLYEFDVNQIESMTLLSGATAKAKYGPRASYGAIYIKTRKGSWNSPLKVNLDIRSGIDFVDRFPGWVSGKDYAILNNHARFVDGYPKQFTEEQIDGFAMGDMFNRQTPSVDYRSLMLRNYKPSSSFGFDLSGGSNIMKYSASISGLRNEDIYNVGPEANYNKINLSSSITAKVGKYLVGNVSFNGHTAFRNGNNGSLTSFRSIPAVAFPVALGVSTNESDLDGVSAGNTLYSVSRAYTSNPYAQMVDGGFFTTRYRGGMFNATIDFDMCWLLEGLKSKTFVNAASEYYQKVGKENDYIAYYWDADTDVGLISSHVGTKQASKSSKSTFTYETLSMYERLYYERKSAMHNFEAGATFYLSDCNHSSSDYYERQAYLVGNVDYNYGGKYFVEAAVQYAGCSRFAPENRYAFFPTVAASWIASREGFLKDVSWLNLLKFRVDAGSIADADVFGTKYLYRAKYDSASGDTFGPATAYQWFGSDKHTSQTTTIKRLANHDIKWPRINQIDLGIDAKLFGCIDLGVDAYVIKRQGLLTDVSSVYPIVTGLEDITLYDNYNEYLIRGIDASVRYSKRFGDLSLSVGASVMTWKNTRTKVAGDIFQYPWQQLEGSDNDAYRGFVCLGVFENDEQIASSPLYDANTKVGDLMYKDLNDDGKIDANDKMVIGNTAPRLRYSLDIDLKWKNLSLFVVGTGRAGYDVALTNEYFWNGWEDGNYSNFVLENVGGEYPRLGYDKSSNNFVASTFWLRSGNYFKIQTAELSYDLKWPNAKFVKGMRLSLRGTNLLTFTNLQYVDPENVDAGVSEYPLFRTVALGAKLNF